jgi:replication factor A1
MSFTLESLTPHSISTILTLQSADSDRTFQPVLQILSLKAVGQDTGRYRAVLSDGQHFTHGMLATQMKGLIENGELQVNSIVKITDFMNNAVQDRNIVIVLQLQVLGMATQRLGDPQDLKKAPASSSSSLGAAAAVATAPMYNRTNTSATTAAVKSSPSKAAGTNPYFSSPVGSRAPGSTHKSSAAPIVATSSSPGGTPLTLIANLNMYQNRWTIKARVVAKSDIRTWSNPKGEGSLFSIDLLDSSGVDIRATMFKESVDKYYNFLQVGKVYTIGGGKIKVANLKWNTCKSQYEMSLDVNSVIQLADDAGEIQVQSFDFIKIGRLEEVEPNKMVDVIGIVQEVSEVQSLMSKKTGQELQKADVTVIDDTGCQVRLTLWGTQAVNAPREVPVHKVVAFRRARVSDYGGVTLSGPQGTFVEPAVPETEALYDWWKSQGSRAAPVKSLSSSGGTGGKMDPFSERKTIADIKNLNLGYQNQEKGDYLCFKANFTFFKKDKEGGAWYTACPNKEEPCRNRCKVTQTTDGNWQCDRCQGTYPTCTRKWIFSGTVGDDSGATWVSLFDDQALTLFHGATADDVFAQYENQDAYDGIFARAQYSEWIFKCRVKSEMVNDEPRLKTSVVRMDPVDYVAESNHILAQLEQWQI